MKICTYKKNSGLNEVKRLGLLLKSGKIVDPNLCFRAYFEVLGKCNAQERADHLMPPSLYQLLTLSEEPLELLQRSLDYYEKYHQKFPELELTAELGMPIDKINIYRDFFAHEKHVKTGFAKRNEPIPPAWYEIPVYYKGNPQSFIGPEEEVLWPSFTQVLDYELELACVLYKEGKNIKKKNAKNHILGFSILNDISARDLQKKEMSVRLGPSKSKDFCSVLGPVIVTFDEFSFVEPDLLMTAKINGETWSQGQSGDVKYSFSEMIEFASQDEWLKPGDVLGSGTVGTGCGLEIDKWIKPGDTVELEIEKIGVLKNKIGKPKES